MSPRMTDDSPPSRKQMYVDACARACAAAGIRDPEKDIPAMLAALRELAEVCGVMLALGPADDGVRKCKILKTDAKARVRRARAILARIDGAAGA